MIGGFEGGEVGEEETVAGDEIVGGECVEWRERFKGVDCGEDTVVVGIHGEA
jgi:hypothetical protein